MRLRHLVLAISLLLQAASPAQPNVLLIITDDQGYGDFSIHDHPHLKTPNIDRLAREGVRFDRFYVNSFCAPTRASLLTGRWSLRTGVHGVTHNKEAMKPSEVTLAEAFGANGYRTACIGKWHNPIDETNKFPGAVRTARHRLVREIKGPAGGSGARANDSGAGAWHFYDMKADPGEEKDIAAEHPDLVRHLAAAYDAWFADIAADGRQRFPLPVGHEAHNPVELHAPQAVLGKPLRFASGPGFANDWITGWSDPKGRVVFPVDVATAGRYEVGLAYGAVKDTVVRVGGNGQTVEALLPAAEAPEIPLRHRDADGRTRYRDRRWAERTLGFLELVPGRGEIAIECLAAPGIELKHLKLTRISGGERGTGS